jgi:hypothetical protein
VTLEYRSPIRRFIGILFLAMVNTNWVQGVKVTGWHSCANLCRRTKLPQVEGRGRVLEGVPGHKVLIRTFCLPIYTPHTSLRPFLLPGIKREVVGGNEWNP